MLWSRKPDGPASEPCPCPCPSSCASLPSAGPVPCRRPPHARRAGAGRPPGPRGAPHAGGPRASTRSARRCRPGVVDRVLQVLRRDRLRRLALVGGLEHERTGIKGLDFVSSRCTASAWPRSRRRATIPDQRALVVARSPPSPEAWRLLARSSAPGPSARPCPPAAHGPASWVAARGATRDARSNWDDIGGCYAFTIRRGIPVRATSARRCPLGQTSGRSVPPALQRLIREGCCP